MTNFVVSSGFIDLLIGLSSGDTMWVLASGASSQTTVSNGGQLFIASGGQSLGDTVLSGGLEVLSSGATGSGITVSAGGKLSGAGMLSGSTLDFGLISGVTISSGGGIASVTVENHGVASGVTVGESFANILSGGTARDLVAVGTSLITVSAGATTTGTLVASDGGQEDVHGVVHGTILQEAAAEVIFRGGLAVGTVVSSGGTLEVSSGGIASAAVIFNGGTQRVDSGAHAKGTTVSSGGTEIDSAGGIAQNSILAASGVEDVLSGGLASGFTISSGGGLIVSSGGVARVAATGSSTNFGFIDVQSTAELDLAGTLYNGGFVTLDNSNIVSVIAAKVTLTGSGAIDMADSDLIKGASASNVLDNESETIEGTGQIGGDSLTVINRGVIDANQLGGLTLNATLVTNTGLIEAGSGEALNVFGPINNSGGAIEANGGDIFLESTSTISGGVLSDSGNGEFVVAGDAGLDGTGQAVVNNAKISVGDGTQLTLDGAIDNVGEISLESLADVTTLVIDGSTVTLTGSGTVLMSDGVGNAIEGDSTTSANTLVNVDNTIIGAGALGGQNLILVNSGTIDANGVSNAMGIDATSVTNTGLIEATGAAGMVIVTTINNSGGRIAANGGNIYFDAGGVILGGTLTSTPGSAIYTDNSAPSVATLNGVASPVTNTGDVTVLNSTQLDIIGAIVNSGVISVGGGARFTDLVVNGASATLAGGGLVELSDTLSNRVYGASAADTLTNVNDTIEGAGQIGNGDQLTLVNSGTIDASGVNNLFLNTTSAVNTGLIESTNTGGLIIQTAVENVGGVIAANDGNIELDLGAVVSGGLLTASSESDFSIGDAATLDGRASPLTNSATIYVDDAGQLTLAGAIVNNGVISLSSTADATALVVGAATVTLTGHGTIELSDNGQDRIVAAAPADVLNNETNTIEGGGEIGRSQLTLINGGIVDANDAATSLQLDTTGAVTNTGLIESTNAGGLFIQSNIQNAGGVIAAKDGNVFLEGSTISGGVLSSTGGGVIHDEGLATLDGAASQLTNKGHVGVDKGLQLFLEGAIANDGTISLDASGENTDLIVGSTTATLTGTGTIELADDPHSRIFGAVGADVLDNEFNIIEGAGQIGVGQLTLINRGTIDATGENYALAVDTLSATNTGLIEATTAPGLVIESVINNSGGVIGAFGGDVTVQSGAAVSGGTLSGQGGGDNLIEVLSGGSLLSASVGSGALEIVSAGAIQRGVTVLLSGAEEVLSGATTTASVILKGGFETMSAGAATSGATVSSGGFLLGPGSLFQAVKDYGVISGALLRNSGVLDVFSGGVTSGVHIGSGGLEVLSGGRAVAAVVSSGGVLRAVSGGTATGTLLHKGGTETIADGGVAVGTVLSGGVEFDFGFASGTVLRSGGHEVVAAHATASGSMISKGGQELVSSGGVTEAATVFASGSLIVSSGGTAFGGLTIHGGHVTLDGAMGSGQTIDFAGVNGVLRLDNLAAFQAQISGLKGPGQKLDLGGLTFSVGETVTWTQAGTSGTLKVHDGAKTASLTLIGTYVTGDFSLSNDTHGGTFVVDPAAPQAVAAPTAAQFVQAAAGFNAGRGGPAAIHSGGTAAMIAPPLLNATASGAAHG